MMICRRDAHGHGSAAKVNTLFPGYQGISSDGVGAHYERVVDAYLFFIKYGADMGVPLDDARLS